MIRRLWVFALALALLMQVMTPAIGYAGEKSDSPSLGPWAALLKHFEEPLHSCAPVSADVAAWRSGLRHWKRLSAYAQMKAVNDFINTVPYVDDLARYGSNGYWAATPERFFSAGGDCKDYALAKYASLRALGFLPDRLRITVVLDKVKNVPHAILIVDDAFVLDNQFQTIQSVENINQYQLLFSLNSLGWHTES